MVVATHLGGIPRVGQYAVFGFYCLSGYLMTLIMNRNYGYSLSGFSKYALNRFLRIYPIYWLSVLLSLLLIWLWGQAEVSDYHPAIYLPQSVLDGLRNAFIFFPLRQSPILTPPSWALTVELFFYLLIGLGLSKLRLVTWIWFLISVAYHTAAMIEGVDWASRYFTIYAASLPFSTGALMFHYRDWVIRFFENTFGKFSVYLPSLILSAIFINWLIGDITGLSEGLSFYVNYMLCALIIPCLHFRDKWLFVNKSLDKKIGDLSYPIYLFHYQIGFLVTVMLGLGGFGVERPDRLLMVIAIPLILMFAYSVAVVVERPIEVIRSAVKRIRTKLD